MHKDIECLKLLWFEKVLNYGMRVIRYFHLLILFNYLVLHPSKSFAFTVRFYETSIQTIFLKEDKKHGNKIHVEHVDTPWEFIYHARMADIDSRE